MTNEPDEKRERKFYPDRRAVHSSLKVFIADATAQLLGVMRRSKGHKPQGLQTLNAIVDAVLCDLIACVLSDDPALIISLSAAKLHGPLSRRYYSDLERSKQFGPIIEALGKSPLDLLVFNKARPWKPKPGRTLRASTIRPSDALFAVVGQHRWSFESMEHVKIRTAIRELIILKREKDPENAYWDKAEAIGYDDNGTTAPELRQQMVVLNAALAKLNLRMIKSGSSVYQADLGDTALRRIFLLSRTEFDSGGRLAGGFWSNMPSKERWRLRINGEPVIILDFGQLNPSLCYAREGADMTTPDAYVIENAPDGVPRSHWKKLFNALLFVKGPMKRFPKGLNIEAMGGLTVGAATNLLKAAHQNINDCFETLFGYELQYHESNILIGILKRFAYALPLHDAIMVPMSKVATARAVMKDVFEDYTAKEFGHRSEARISATFPLLDHVASTHMTGTSFVIQNTSSILVSGGGQGKSRHIELSRGIEARCNNPWWFRGALPDYARILGLPNPRVRFKPESVHGSKSRKGEWLAVDFGYIELPGKTPRGEPDFDRAKLMACVAVSRPDGGNSVLQALVIPTTAETTKKDRAKVDDDVEDMFTDFLCQFGYSARSVANSKALIEPPEGGNPGGGISEGGSRAHKRLPHRAKRFKRQVGSEG